MKQAASLLSASLASCPGKRPSSAVASRTGRVVQTLISFEMTVTGCICELLKGRQLSVEGRAWAFSRQSRWGQRQQSLLLLPVSVFVLPPPPSSPPPLPLPYSILPLLPPPALILPPLPSSFPPSPPLLVLPSSSLSYPPPPPHLPSIPEPQPQAHSSCSPTAPPPRSPLPCWPITPSP